MQPLLVAILAGVGFIIAYHTYGRWLGRRIFQLSAQAVCPSIRLNDGTDYVPTPKSVVFGHHFTSIAGTGPIVGPAIAIMWGWLPALLWVVFGSILIGAVHDLGSLVVSLRNNGQTVGDIAGRVLNKRTRILFLLVLFMGLTIVLAIFGLVIAAVFRQYPAAIFPCMVQIPIAVAIGFWIYRRGGNLLIPSILALALMYVTVIIGDENFRTDIVGLKALMHALHGFNAWMADLTNWEWVVILLIYSYIASVLPVWVLLQPRDYINSLQLISALGLILVGLGVAAFAGGHPPVEGATRPPLEFVAPMVNWNPAGAPMIVPFLFITIACGAISGFHCLVSSGTSSKQLKSEPDARFVGYGGMLTEGFLATLVILACAAGVGLGTQGLGYAPSLDKAYERAATHGELVYSSDATDAAFVGQAAWLKFYPSWLEADRGLGSKVGAFVVGAANFVNALGIPMGVCIALMGVLVASFAGTTMDTACRLQRYVIQELAATFLGEGVPARGGVGAEAHPPLRARGEGRGEGGFAEDQNGSTQGLSPLTPTLSPRGERENEFNPLNPIHLLRTVHGATILAVITAAALAAIPLPGQAWSLANAGAGGMILWPLFGATNQLLGGLAFMVILFYLWRRGKPIWFIILPMIFMLIMPAWAMTYQVLYEWWPGQRWSLVGIGVFTLVLEAWMIVEGALMFPKVRNVLESDVMIPQRGFEVVGAGSARG